MSKLSGSTFDMALFKRLLRAALVHKKVFYVALMATLSAAFISPVRPALVQYITDHIYLIAQSEQMLWFSFWLVFVLIVESFFQYLSSYYSGLLGLNVVMDLRNSLFNRLLHYKLSFYDRTPVGTLVTRTVSDIQNIADTFSMGFMDILGDLLKVAVIVCVMTFTNWQLTLFSLSTIPVLFYATYIFKNAIKAAFTEVSLRVAELNAFTQEHITGMGIVQIFNREEQEYNKFRNINNLHRNANNRGVWHYSVFFPVVEILSAISIGIVVWWGSVQVLHNEVSAGVIISFILYINMLFRPIRQLADRFNTLQMGMVCSERVFKLMDEPESESNEGNIDAGPVKGEITFKDVSFGYQEKNPVIKHLSFQVRAGEQIAVVGHTGSGKSTLAALLTRLYDFKEGEILLDGTPVRSYQLNDLRHRMAIVMQDVFLLPESIYRNVVMEDFSIPLQEVITAAKEVGIHDFIESLPGGYEFNVKERGALLSAGQRQLIAFLRAYLYNPGVLILDEATSNVDTETEKLIQTATERLTRNRTCLIIAHRLSTITRSDRILVMKEGAIAESGNHQELLSRKGIYHELHQMQFQTAVH